MRIAHRLSATTEAALRNCTCQSYVCRNGYRAKFGFTVINRISFAFFKFRRAENYRLTILRSSGLKHRVARRIFHRYDVSCRNDVRLRITDDVCRRIQRRSFNHSAHRSCNYSASVYQNSAVRIESAVTVTLSTY